MHASSALRMRESSLKRYGDDFNEHFSVYKSGNLSDGLRKQLILRGKVLDE